MLNVQIDLRGGIGNQLFGGALALALVSTTKSTRVICSDRLISLGVNPTRDLQIDKLGIFSHPRIEFVKSNNFFIKILIGNSLLRRVWWRISKWQLRESVISQRDIWDLKVPRSKTLVFSDYFDNWFFIEQATKSLYFPPYPTFSRENSELKNVEKLIEDKEVIVIHCRIGDYVDLPEYHKILPESYFLSAIKRLNENQETSPRIVIFCESFHQLSEYYPNLSKLATRIVDSNSGFSDIDSFSLMCRSHNLIAANSTFSSWAAWFVQRRGFKVVRPVLSKRVAEEDGSIYLDWTLFDLETCFFIQGDSSDKNAWLKQKSQIFCRFESLFQ